MWDIIFIILLICEALLTFFFVRSFIKSKKANSETVGYFITILILGYTIYLIPFFYEQIVINSTGNILIGLLSCLFSAIKMFAFDYLTDSMKEFIAIYPIYSVVFTLGSILAMFTTVLTTVSFFYVNLLNHTRLKKRLNNDNNVIVIGLGKIEMEYLEKNESKVIWPFKKLKKEDFIELIDNGYAIITEPISQKTLSSKLFKNKNFYQFYHLSENEDEEVMLIECFKKNSQHNNMFLHLNMSQIKVEVFKRKLIEHNITNIDIFSINEKLIQNLLFDVPLTSKLSDQFINTNYGVIDPDKQINVFMIGYDEINEQLLPKLITNNQLPTIKDNKFSSFKVNYIILDKFISLDDAKVFDEISVIKQKVIDNNNEYFAPFEDIAKVHFNTFDVHSIELVDFIYGYVKNPNSFNYFYVSTGNKYKNIIISDTLSNELNEFDNVHFVINSGKKDLVGEINYNNKMSYYGDYKDILEITDLSNNKIIDLAKAFDQHNWNRLSFFARENKISYALSLRTKLNLIGLDICLKDKVYESDVIVTPNDYKQITSKYSLDEWGSDNGYDYNILTKENALIYQEFLRHCCERLFAGFEPLKRSDTKYDDKQRLHSVNYLKKEDLFLTSYYEIENIKLHIFETSRKYNMTYEDIMNRYEIRQYDMFYLQRLAYTLESEDFVLIKK